MKPTIELSDRNDLSEFKAVSLLQSCQTSATEFEPIPMDKESFDRLKKPDTASKPKDLKDCIDDVLAVVHGS